MVSVRPPDRGTRVVVVGSKGSGKTSLIRCLAGRAIDDASGDSTVTIIRVEGTDGKIEEAEGSRPTLLLLK